METRVYYGDWSTREEMVHDFDPSNGSLWRDGEGGVVPEDADILIAAYTYENYSGTAFVLFRRDGKLYEVNGGHCSCYGLEGQWDPEEVVLAELVKRPCVFGYCYDSDYEGQGEQNINAAIKRVVTSLAEPESEVEQWRKTVSRRPQG